MAIQDNCPERRNVIVMSMAAITYFVADGSFNGGIKLPIFSLELHNPLAAVIIFWCVYSWVVFRYYLQFANEPFDKDSKIYDESSPNWKHALFAAIGHSAIAPGRLDSLLMKYPSIKDSDAWNEAYGQSLRNGGFCIKRLIDNNYWVLCPKISNGRPSYTIKLNDKISKLHMYWLLTAQFARCSFANTYVSAWYLPWLLILTTLVIALAHVDYISIALSTCFNTPLSYLC